MKLMIVLALTALAVALVAARPATRHTQAGDDDEITSLPKLNFTLPFRQYSGYLQAGGAKMLHYWFVESMNNPDSDPLVLWLNGGPGCSSLDGFLSELGPLHINNDGTLYLNQYAWNKIANVIFLEAPAGVGFSYSPDSSDYSTDDITVANDNYLALQSFFAKFPAFVGRDFYVTGESYGGVYVPTLAQRIVDGPVAANEVPINLKAIAIGNGLLSYELNDNSAMYFGYFHGLFGDDAWLQLTSACCDADNKCNFHAPSTQQCQDLVTNAMNIIYNDGLNYYALYLDCYHNSVRVQHDRENMFRHVRARLNKDVDPVRKLAQGSSNGAVPCIDDHLASAYLNRADVRAALHIPTSVQKWEICSDVIINNYNRTYQTVVPILQDLIQHIHILVYNGDTDMACNFLGDQWAVDSMGLQVVEDRRMWNVNGQVAGFVKTFDRVTYLTVKGAGHMVPQWAPVQALHMFTSFLQNKPY